MSAIFHDSGVPSFLAPKVDCEYYEQAIAEAHYQEQVRIALGNQWWWLRQRNILSHEHNDPVRIGYRWWNWAPFARPAQYWRGKISYSLRSA